MFESGVVRHADLKMIVMKEEVILREPQSQETGHGMPCRVPWGRIRVKSRGRGREGKMWARVFIVVSVEGSDEVG